LLQNYLLFLLAKSRGTVFQMTLHVLYHWQCFGVLAKTEQTFIDSHIWKLLCSLSAVVLAMVILAVIY